MPWHADRAKINVKRLLFTSILGSALAVSACSSGSVRSGSIDKLASIEGDKLKQLHDQMAAKTTAVNAAIDQLKSSYSSELDAQQIWERQVLDAKLVAAVPGNLKDPITKRAVYVELAELHLDNSDLFATQRAAFNTQADALKAAYAKLVDALAQSQKDFGPVASYTGASSVDYAVASIDVATIGAAIGEFQQAQKILTEAQSVAAKAQPTLGTASKATSDVSVQNFLSVMSQISQQVQKIPNK